MFHASIAAVWDRVISDVREFVCESVRAVKGKRLELSTPNLVHYGSRWTVGMHDPEVKRSEVKVTRLQKPLHSCRRTYGC